MTQLDKYVQPLVDVTHLDRAMIEEAIVSILDRQPNCLNPVVMMLGLLTVEEAQFYYYRGELESKLESLIAQATYRTPPIS